MTRWPPILHCRHHHFMAREIQSKRMADEFVVHSTEEQGHGDEIAERIAQ
jgi:bacterioferritin